MSIFSFRKLVKSKPSIWTLHDPWALTGHCVHPVDCKGWLTGCKNCNYLNRYAPLKKDHAHAIWEIKKQIYQDIDIDIIVSSDWMLNMVKKSPLTRHFKKVHKIPFGIDLDLFKRKSNRLEIRKKLGIKKDEVVLMFRQSSEEWKGLMYIKKLLEGLDGKNVVLLTVGETGLLNNLKGKYKIIENKWINDNNKLVDLYSAADIFLMPSIAESFGLMAVEAMACSLPVIVFNGTALPDVTFAPECGIAVDKNKPSDLLTVTKRLIESKEEREERGKIGRKLALEHYPFNKYVSKTIELYKEVYNRNYGTK
jgi:glycosyltransferase involved in cell wall biosynthesis